MSLPSLPAAPAALPPGYRLRSFRGPGMPAGAGRVHWVAVAPAALEEV